MATAPEGGWWQEKVGGLEKVWVLLAALLVVVAFSAWMLIWHAVGRQNAHGDSYTVDAATFMADVRSFVDKYKVGEENGIPVVEPPPGSDVYVAAYRFAWYPILRLKKGQEYRLHVAALDYLHGFSVANPYQWSVQLYPGYEWVMRFTPTQSRSYSLVCNDYCGLGHHTMVGKIIVAEE